MMASAPIFFNDFGIGIAAIIGLVVGSFLNVVIYRLPQVVATQSELGAEQAPASLTVLLSPGSTTPCCQTRIAWYDNIPMFSWLLLKGKCRLCKQPISFRYFLVELLTALGFSWVYWQFGFSWAGLFYASFFAGFISLFFIDLETYYLPDYLTFGLLWLALIGSATGILVCSASEAILGASFGYLLPWATNCIYWLWRRRDGFGGGDFKLMAALGAWLGVAAVIPILAIASVLALLVIGIWMLLKKERFDLNRMLPFGPFLILAAAILFFDSQGFKFLIER
jgi:leader peptidase (prepilin peptidase)/N-methyltransferase